MRRLLLFLAPLLMAQNSPMPQVPEAIHSLAKGPETFCGVTASSAQDFERQVKVSANAKRVTDTDRFTAYEGPAEMTVWVFAKPTNSAYPLATCRYVYVKDGATYMGRKMRCDDTRERCDRAFIEFNELDQHAAASVRGSQH